ncbi:heparan sulfate 2-O-sulfotransferase pipe isoform X6 [Drosophila ficusphila]|uniref:heparan sulfate 2-O-sulfotransferase pipe isoform X6 n=1 Tax=Drosophila ficusphila TaxID=30025 RepID=UPI0007E80835|nr:heparan sulfate 2-O-sulfotransferase pipe isoform X6 [Drosophila ficusphila]
MSLNADRSYKMKLRDVENAFKYRRIPYPKRSVELIALLAISCTFFLFMHTNKLNSRLKEMEVKLQPSEFSALGLTGNHISGHDAGKHDDINTLHGTYQYLKSTGQLASLSSETLNNTRNSKLEVIFFNRGAKVGSEALMELTQTMAPYNDLKVVTKGPIDTNSRTRSPGERMIQALWVTELDPGTVYIEHCNWLDFHRYQLPKPIYINLVRDPVERMISWYYYVRSGYRNAIHHRKFPNATIQSEKWFKKNYNDCVRSGDPECQYVPGTVKEAVGNFMRQTLFFCGHERHCLPFDSPRAIQVAKLHVERDYAVVGTWEETNITLTVFEAYIPRFFKGVRNIFEMHSKSIRNRNRNNRKPHIDPDVREMVRQNFTNEYEFYYFCKQRLYKQYLALQFENNLH